MRSELPVCTRCCFCLPLRYGLITWGYIRLVVSMLFLIGMSINFYTVLHSEEKKYITSIILISIMLLIPITDFVLNTVFIVGGHKKNAKLLRAYYIYSVIICTLTGLASLASFIKIFLTFARNKDFILFYLWFTCTHIGLTIAQVLIQIYMILLVRSEIVKLEKNCEFRFVNIATEAECAVESNVEINSEDGCK